MKNITRFIFLFLSLLLLAEHSIAQCDQQSNPNKWLYKNGFGRIDVSYPQKVEYATKMTLFFDAFVFLSMYSFVKAGNDRFFYIQFSGPASYPYDVLESDSIEFYFNKKEVMKLDPQTDYQGEKGALLAFYKVDKQFLNVMAETNLDSIILRFTPHLNGKVVEESKQVKSFTFKKLSQKQIKKFKEYADCFRKEY